MWVRRVLSGLFLVLLICGVARAGTIAAWNGTMYVSPDQVTVTWDAVNDTRVTGYELRVLWIDQRPPQIIEIGDTNATNMTVQGPRTGHFKLQVRSVSDTHNMTSRWANSTSNEDTAGAPWRIYFTVPSVEGVNVE